MKRKIEVWNSLFSLGESTIYIEDAETKESFGEYTYIQNSGVSPKEVFEATGRIKGSYRGICMAIRDCRDYENHIIERNRRAYNNYWRK